MVAREKVDVVIVGAGAASSVFAATLAEVGKSVLCLEAGPAWKLTDLYSSNIWSRRLKWTSPHVLDGGKLSYNLNAGRGFGGTALHHGGLWPRYHEEDFKLKTLYGRGLDWPFDYNELRPYYDKVQRDVGMSGDAEQEIWRPPGDPYPLPPVPVFGQGKLLRRGFEQLGMRVAPTPVAILSKPYNGRPACIWDGWCEAGCPTGALANPLVTYFPRALKAGAKVQADSHVTRILTNTKGDRAIGVEYFNAEGERQVQHADVMVLAPFTIGTSRLLLNSKNDKHPTGLGNGSGLVGRYLSSHPAVVLFGLFEEETQPYMGIMAGNLFSQDRFAKDGHPSGAFGSRQWEIGYSLKPNDLLGIAVTRPDLIGHELDAFMQKAVRHMAVMGSICEDQALESNQVVLAQKRDRYGMPQARIAYKPSTDGLQLYRDSIREGKQIFKAAGATEIWNSPMGMQHHLGGTIMGDDPTRSVTNRYCQLHEVDNLIIGSLSVAPTASCVNSTYTLHALSMRAAEHLITEWNAIAG